MSKETELSALVSPNLPIPRKSRRLFFSWLRFVDFKAALILAGSFTSILVLWSLPRETNLKLTREGGLIENLTPAVFAFAGIIAAFQCVHRRSCCWMAGTLLILAAYLRELDYQKMFTDRSIDSIGFYSHPHIPLQTKLWVILALSPIVISAIGLFVQLKKHFRTILQTPPLWARYTVIGFAMAAFGVLCEKAKLDSTNSIEEICELAFAVFILFTVLEFRKRSSGSLETSSSLSSVPQPASLNDGEVPQKQSRVSGV